MLHSLGLIRETARLIDEAAENTCSDLSDSWLEQEPEFTATLVERIRATIDGVGLKGVIWRAKVLTSLGPGAQENTLGADFAGVLSVTIPEYSVAKGFLCQAKLTGKDWRLSTAQMTSASKQCEKMLRYTPDSFLVLYNRAGVWVVPALSVVSHAPGQPLDLYGRSLGSLIGLHIESFIGDRRISSPDVAVLRDSLGEATPGRVLALSLGTSKGEEI